MEYYSLNKNKILKVRLTKYANIPPVISAWNIFDIEHVTHIHGKRTMGDGMNESILLLENKNFYLTVDEQRMPILSFIKRKSLLLHYRNSENTVYQWSCFFGIPILQRFKVSKVDEGHFKHTIDYAFELSGYMKFFSFLIKFYASKWMKKTWEEDLVLKQRYYKFLNLGFKNLRGLPENIKDRHKEVKDENVMIPLPKAKFSTTLHPFFYDNIDKLFDK